MAVVFLLDVDNTLIDNDRARDRLTAEKEDRLDDVAKLFPATRYVAVDDKAGLLARIKRHWGAKVGTVHVLQGKYADDPYDGHRPDAAIASIGDLAALVGTADRLRLLLEKAEDARRIA